MPCEAGGLRAGREQLLQPPPLPARPEFFTQPVAPGSRCSVPPKIVPGVCKGVKGNVVLACLVLGVGFGG